MSDTKVTIINPNKHNKLIAYEHGVATHDIIGFKLVEPHGVTLYLEHGTVTMPLSSVTIKYVETARE